MLSQKRTGVLYPANTDIANFDLGTDVEEYTYDGREVFRGTSIPNSRTQSTKYTGFTMKISV